MAKYFYGRHKADNSFGFDVVADGQTSQLLENPAELTQAYYEELLYKQTQNLEIRADDNGYPIAEAHEADDAEKAAELRQLRNQYLEKSDIEMLSDNWLKKTESERLLWTEYRQYLRDIPQSEAFPETEVKTFEAWQNVEA